MADWSGPPPSNVSVVRTMYFRPRVAAISYIGVKDNETTLESDSHADTFVLGGGYPGNT